MNQINQYQRPAAVAGTFYPGDKDELEQSVTQFLGSKPAFHNSTGEQVPKALIVPHAGFCYSGDIAASGYALLTACKSIISRVVMVGPAHRVRVDGIAASGAQSFFTPTGKIPVDTQSIARCIGEFPFVEENDLAHQAEHCLETQLPFLQKILQQFSIVPLVVGNAKPEEVTRCLDYLWGEEETLILISSDLSHFHPYHQAQSLDRFTSNSILQLQPQPISYEHACGQVGIRGLLLMAQNRKLRPKLIDLRNSGDTAGTKERVVGYGCFAFYPPKQRIDTQHRNQLTQIARASIDYGFAHGKQCIPVAPDDSPIFVEIAGSFITLTDKNNKLRGCIGTLVSSTSLVQNVSDNAFNAAFRDHRFKPLTRAEWESTRLEISIVSEPEKMKCATEREVIQNLRPYCEGLILKEKNKQGTFLPAVWKKIPDREKFMTQLKLKAGLAENYWSDNIEVYRYTTESWFGPDNS